LFLLFSRLEIFPDSYLLRLSNQLSFFQTLVIISIELSVLWSVKLSETSLEDFISDITSRMIYASIEVPRGTVGSWFVSFELDTNCSVKKKLLNKGFTLSDLGLINTLLRSEKEYHGDLGNCLILVNIDCQERGIEHVFYNSFKRLFDLFCFFIELSSTVAAV